MKSLKSNKDKSYIYDTISNDKRSMLVKMVKLF